MIDMVNRLISSLCNWLENPRIRIEMMASEEVAALQIQVQQLQSDLVKSRRDNELLMGRYTNELSINFTLQDLLKENNIKWR